MTPFWQNLVALGIVGIAVGYLVARVWTIVRQRSATGCGGGCHGCSSNREAKLPVDAIVTIDFKRNSPL